MCPGPLRIYLKFSLLVIENNIKLIQNSRTLTLIMGLGRLNVKILKAIN